MRRWEYASFDYRAVHVDGKWKTKFFLINPDGKQTELNDDTNIMVLLNKLGSQGWEVVNSQITKAGMFQDIMSDGQPYNNATPVSRTYLLKRPVE